MKYVAVVAAVFAMIFLQTALADESAEKFFEKYVQLNDDFDPSVAKLYSDDRKTGDRPPLN